MELEFRVGYIGLIRLIYDGYTVGTIFISFFIIF